ncbi:MAG: T9SS type A sorting domain-containing protein [Bacteroidetes bacterium]|nr:T9SS type A sorting domain-containing protein [Bacteroidota bacterium]
MKKTTTFFTFLITIAAFGQTTFQSRFGRGSSYYPAVILTHDGNFLIAGGSLNHQNGTVYATLKKIDTKGDVLWSNTYVDYYHATSLEQINDSEYIFACHGFSSGASFMKVDSVGYPINYKTYYNIQDYFTQEAICSKPTADGGFVVAGNSQHFTSLNTKPYLIKTNSYGDTLWSRAYGGASYDYFGALEVTSDGSYVITGWTANFGGGGGVYLTKIDSLGDVIWSKVYGGPSMDRGFSIHQNFDKGYIIGGFTDNYGAGDSDAFLLRTDSMGQVIWAKAYGNSGYDKVNSVCQTSDSGFVFTGVISDDDHNWNAYLVKVNSMGDTIWTKSYGGKNTALPIGTCVRQTNDLGYIIAGPAQDSIGGIYIIKTDSKGNSSCGDHPIPTIVTTAPISARNTFPSALGLPSGTFGTYPSNILTKDTAITICYVSGISEGRDSDAIVIFPNPTSDIINISVHKNIFNGTMNVFNDIGEKVYSQAFNGRKELINYKLKQGIYFMQLTNGNETWTQKIIIVQ